MTGRTGKAGKDRTEGSRKTGNQARRTPNTPDDAMADAAEKNTQFTLTLRESLHRSLAMMALENHMTMRGFIMQALRDAGLPVEEQDLVDRRRR